MGIFDCHMHTLELSPHRDSVCSFMCFKITVKNRLFHQVQEKGMCIWQVHVSAHASVHIVLILYLFPLGWVVGLLGEVSDC